MRRKNGQRLATDDETVPARRDTVARVWLSVLLPVSYLTDFDKGTPEVYDRPATNQWAQEPLFFNEADGLVSTAHDYFRFASMLLHSGVANGKRILSAESVAAMTRNQLKAGSGFMGDDAYYGFGLGLQVVIREGLGRR